MLKMNDVDAYRIDYWVVYDEKNKEDAQSVMFELKEKGFVVEEKLGMGVSQECIVLADNCNTKAILQINGDMLKVIDMVLGNVTSIPYNTFMNCLNEKQSVTSIH